jgi:hypothetical protein
MAWRKQHTTVGRVRPSVQLRSFEGLGYGVACLRRPDEGANRDRRCPHRPGRPSEGQSGHPLRGCRYWRSQGVPRDATGIADVLIGPDGPARANQEIGGPRDATGIADVLIGPDGPAVCYSTRPRFTAYRTNSAWLCKPSLRMKFSRWVSAVRGLMVRRSAISLVVRPSASRCSTSRSRGVSNS